MTNEKIRTIVISFLKIKFADCSRKDSAIEDIFKMMDK